MFNIIGAVLFIDGDFRPVYLDKGGHEYFIGRDGLPVYGDWASLDGPDIVVP